MTTVETIRFKNDTATRKRLMVPESFSHPAKGQLGMWALMIERYSQPGDLVLDPMAGSGATLLAALMGRNVICVELEQHFVDPMSQSWEKMRTMPMLGHEMGQAVIIRGDARALPLPDASVGTAFTSPPYEGSLQGDEPTGKLFETERRVNSPASGNRKSFRKPLGQGYSKLQARADRVAKAQGPNARNVFQEALENPKAVSRRGYEYGYTRPVDAIVTSPPYENTSHPGEGKAGQERPSVGATGYTRPVDTIITSPPYEGAVSGGHNSIDWTKSERDGDVSHWPSKMLGKSGNPFMQYGTGENIGNLRNAAYWNAMALCYAECWRVLKPGGIMALVLKGFTRDGKYVDLPGQTEALLLEAGWQKHDEWRRQLWSLSFWRILQRRRSPETWDERLGFESVLAFRKPGAARRPELYGMSGRQ